MTTPYTVRQAIDDANPNKLATALQAITLGTSLRKIKATIAAMTASATPDLTAIPAAKITINEGPAQIKASGVLPPIGQLRTLRVTASGTAGSLGTYAVGDAGGTAAIPAGGASVTTGVALLGDDDKTLTFPNTITGFVIEYFAKPGSYLSGGVWKGIDIDTALYAGTADGIGS